MIMSSSAYLLAGEDEYSINLALEDFKAALGAGDLLDANYTRVDGEKITPPDLELVVSASPFLSPKRLVAVYGLMERFEKRSPRAKSRKQKSRQESKDLSGSFAKIIALKPDSTELVIVANTSITGKNPLLEALGGNIEIRKYPLLTGERLEQWIAERVASNGGEITPEGAQILSRQIGPDLWAMSNEIEKLLVYASGEKIDAEKINRMISIAPEANIFHMIDAVVAGRGAVAEVELNSLLSNGIPPSQVIAMLARQVRMISIAQDMLKNGFNAADIRKRLDIKHDFVLQKTLRKARAFSGTGAGSFYALLVNAEMDIKTGRLEPELAMTVLVEGLSRVK